MLSNINEQWSVSCGSSIWFREQFDISTQRQLTTIWCYKNRLYSKVWVFLPGQYCPMSKFRCVTDIHVGFALHVRNVCSERVKFDICHRYFDVVDWQRSICPYVDWLYSYTRDVQYFMLKKWKSDATSSHKSIPIRWIVNHSDHIDLNR